MELDFEYFYRWVKSNLKVNLEGYKENQLQRRITTVMKKSGASDLREYAKLIKSDQEVRKVFLDYITINVSEFYRNKEMFDEFASLIKNTLIPRFGSIKIWSAACSIGAEPYTIAMILDKQHLHLKGSIIATDIDDTILKRAKEGVYSEHEIKNVSKGELHKYFTVDEDKYYISEKIKKRVKFKKHDLILDDYDKGYHAIVCRNVTIYFKNETKNLIYKKFGESLVSGGVLFTGATESIYNPGVYGFRKLSTFIYEKI